MAAESSLANSFFRGSSVEETKVLLSIQLAASSGTFLMVASWLGVGLWRIVMCLRDFRWNFLLSTLNQLLDVPIFLFFLSFAFFLGRVCLGFYFILIYWENEVTGRWRVKIEVCSPCLLCEWEITAPSFANKYCQKLERGRVNYLALVVCGSSIPFAQHNQKLKKKKKQKI